jgi:hypothetical protein
MRMNDIALRQRASRAKRQNEGRAGDAHHQSLAKHACILGISQFDPGNMRALV